MHLICRQVYLHLVWSTFDRQLLLSPEREALVHDIIRIRCASIGAKCLANNGMADHVHVLVSLPSTLSMANVVEDLKGMTSRAVNQSVPPGYGLRWQRGYGAFSVSPNAVPRVVKYIDQQKIHHAHGRANPEMEI